MDKNCVHHWYIGRDSKGVCKKCGKVKMFPPVGRLTVTEYREQRRKASIEVTEARRMTP